MSTGSAVLRVTGNGRDGDVPGVPISAARRRGRPQAIYGVALWVFIGVATTLFTLFVVAYIMRMSNADAAAIAMPRQLWISTALLLAGSVLLHRARVASSDGEVERARQWMRAGGATALLFLAAQWWAWQALLERQVTAVGNPAGSFFYVLTALHGLHVMGGLVGWTIAARAVRRVTDAREAAWRIGLTARYWHFLLLVWLALYASFTWITPEVARIICRTP
ncbi:MAG: cytochrome c oxidase subunit 3 [Rhizobacter sp.]